jgi:hypothetical protein
MNAGNLSAQDNPLLDFSGLPRFAEVRPEHIGPAIDALLGEARITIERVAAAAGTPTWETFVQPLSDALGSMPAQVAELGLDVDDLVFYTRWETELEANWKVVCENFLECYHCSVAHPQLAEMLDVSAEAYALSTDGRLYKESYRDAQLAGTPGVAGGPR